MMTSSWRHNIEFAQEHCSSWGGYRSCSKDRSRDLLTCPVITVPSTSVRSPDWSETDCGSLDRNCFSMSWSAHIQRLQFIWSTDLARKVSSWNFESIRSLVQNNDFGQNYRDLEPYGILTETSKQSRVHKELFPSLFERFQLCKNFEVQRFERFRNLYFATDNSTLIFNINPS